jgi:hypothetical protein
VRYERSRIRKELLTAAGSEARRGDQAAQPNRVLLERPDSGAEQLYAPFDYLNHRAEAKPKAELIHYADPAVFRKLGFEFRMYNEQVLDNWTSWDGSSTPPPH